MQKLTLHTCNFTWIHVGHPCHTVAKALDEAGIPYEIEHHSKRKSKRDDLRAKTGQDVVPAIVFADGTSYRAESKDMAERIRAGKLFDS